MVPIYRSTRIFCEHQTFANFDQFATIKSAKPKLLIVNTHDPCQNAIVACRSQKVNIYPDLAHHKGFSPAKYSSNTVYGKSVGPLFISSRQQVRPERVGVQASTLFDYGPEHTFFWS